MANYLPVLLVSVTAGMPDDAALQPLPRGQVDYLSHEWAEEDVWRSWRNMTKQKNEIANGIRLENASWRTWMKQRNNLKTVSPETLNWLKDSDVTWLYGPLHTAVDWESKAVKKHFDSRLSRHDDHSSVINSISSPSSSIALDRMCEQHPGPPLRTSSHEHPQSGSNTTKSILKHRSIAEMLTGALPPTPSWVEHSNEGGRDESPDNDNESDGGSTENGHDPRESISGRNGRPPLYHTRSDTSVMPKFGRSGPRKDLKVQPPRIADATSSREADVPTHPHALHDYQRTGASNNLLELAVQAAGHSNFYAQTPSGQTSPYRREDTTESPFHDGASGSPGVRFEEPDSAMKDESHSAAQPPTKKHISFNAIVEQCISIDSNSVPATPSSQNGRQWSSYEEESDMDYDSMDIDFTSETSNGNNSSNAQASASRQEVDDDMDDDDSLLEFKTSSRRNSTASLPDYENATSNAYTPYDTARRPQFRRSSTGSGSSRSDRGTALHYSRSSHRSNASSSRSRSSGTQEKDRVTIAPIAPTILKAGGSDGLEDGTLYMGGTPVFELNTGNIRGRDADENNDRSGDEVSGPVAYGYGGYGFGDRVSAGRDDAFRNFERGTEAGELVFQSPNGNIYPWNEKDAIRFCMASEFGLPSPSSSPGSQNASTSSYFSNSSEQAQFVPLQASPQDEAERAEVEHYDEADREVRQINTSDASMDELNGNGRTQSTNTSTSTLERTDQQISPGAGTWMKRGDSTSSSGDSDDRSPSPEVAMKQNPRIASLKTDIYSRQPGQSNHVDHSPSNPSGVPPIPIVRPQIVSGADTDAQHRSYGSPTMQSGLLSPPDLSPRGRWLSTPPEFSGSGTTSYFESGSRSTSESRSDSRGRSQTRNSSITSSDTNEPERGRSRSRSIASGANSPLRESASGSCSPIAGGISIGLGIGGVHNGHTGREIRDGKGTRLYRKTSEDNIGEHYDGHVSHSIRGRIRDGKRVSESLSPPVAASLPADINRRTTPGSPPGKQGQSSSPSTARQNRPRGSNSGVDGKWTYSHSEGNHYGTSGQHLLLNDMPIATLPSVAEYSGDTPRSGSAMDGVTLPANTSQGPPIDASTPCSNNRDSATQDNRGTGSPPVKVSRTDIMSSARSLLGSFWNGQ